MVRIVKAVTTLDAQATVVGRAVAAFHVNYFVVLDVVGQLAADAAIGADRGHLLVGHRQRGVARGHQCAGGAGLHTFAAGDAGGGAHAQLELDRRLVRGRIAHLEQRLDRVQRSREQNRRGRLRSDMNTVSLVGYTNAGKSTLFNALTGSDAFASSQLFATLDPTLRRLQLPDNRSAVLADTVGFVRDLPHDLVAAFRATLEESREARLLLHVIDSADPERSRRIEQVREVLTEIEADSVDRLEVYNKIDLRDGELPRIERDAAGLPMRVWVSAVTGAGLDDLRKAIAERIGPELVERELRLSMSAPGTARLRAQLYQQGVIRKERTDRHGTLHLRVAVTESTLRQLLKQAGLPAPAVAAHRRAT